MEEKVVRERVEAQDYLVLLEPLEREGHQEMYLRLLGHLDLRDRQDLVVYRDFLVWMERKVDEVIPGIRVLQVCQENQDLMAKEVQRETQVNLVLRAEMVLVDELVPVDLLVPPVLWLRAKRCLDQLDHLAWMALRVSLVYQVLKERREQLVKEDNEEKMACQESEDH